MIDRSTKYITMCKGAQYDVREYKPNFHIGDYIVEPNDADLNIKLVNDYSLSSGGNTFCTAFYSDDTLIREWHNDVQPYGLLSYSDSLRKITWLPTIKQIYNIYTNYVKGEMYEKGALVVSLKHFNKWLNEPYAYEYHDKPVYPLLVFHTYEQLWLGFIMHKIFKKQWNDNDKKWYKNGNTL